MPRLGSRVRASFSALFEILILFCKTPIRVANAEEALNNAEIAQLVEHNLAKVGVASSSLVFRSKAVICRSPGGGMVDALVSGASVERRAGSSPVLGTRLFYYDIMEEWRNW